jgi:hypothetical protein
MVESEQPARSQSRRLRELVLGTLVSGDFDFDLPRLGMWFL